MAVKNYLKVFADNTTEATKFRPLFQEGERGRAYVGENPDVLVDGQWWNSTNGGELANNIIGNWTTSNATVTEETSNIKFTSTGPGGNMIYTFTGLTVGKEYALEYLLDLLTIEVTVDILHLDLITLYDTVEYVVVGSFSKSQIIIPTETSIVVKVRESYSTNTSSCYINLSLYEIEIVPDTIYPTQFTYMAKDDELASFLIEGGQPVDIIYDYDSPSIVQNVIQAKKVVQTENRKIIELGTIFNNNRYVVDNPFGNDSYDNCDVKVQLLADGTWSEHKITVNTTSNATGTSAMLSSDGIVIQTAGAFVYVAGPQYGGVGGLDTLASAPARVIVTYQGIAK